MTTSIENEMVDKLRRAIGDIEEPYAYNDSILEEYIADAVDSIQLKWDHEFEVKKLEKDNNNNDDGEEENEEEEYKFVIEPEVPITIQHLFLLEAKYLIIKNRPDVNFSVGSLSVRRGDSGQEVIKEELEKAIMQLRETSAIGKATTEYTQYGRRLDDWLEKLLYAGRLKE